jgi:hypothetical protein
MKGGGRASSSSVLLRWKPRIQPRIQPTRPHNVATSRFPTSVGPRRDPLPCFLPLPPSLSATTITPHQPPKLHGCPPPTAPHKPSHRRCRRHPGACCGAGRRPLPAPHGAGASGDSSAGGHPCRRLLLALQHSSTRADGGKRRGRRGRRSQRGGGLAGGGACGGCRGGGAAAGGGQPGQAGQRSRGAGRGPVFLRGRLCTVCLRLILFRQGYSLMEQPCVCCKLASRCSTGATKGSECLAAAAPLAVAAARDTPAQLAPHHMPANRQAPAVACWLGSQPGQPGCSARAGVTPAHAPPPSPPPPSSSTAGPAAPLAGCRAPWRHRRSPAPPQGCITGGGGGMSVWSG